MAKTENVEWFSHIPAEVVKDAPGYKLGSFLIALEGWRRGLTLTFYSAETTGPEHVKKVGKYFHGRIYSLSSGENTHYFFRSRGDLIADEAVDICKDKEQTKQALRKAGVSVPEGKKFSAETLDSTMVSYAKEIGFPVVLKPTTGSLGNGVYSNIQNEEEFLEDLAALRNEYNYAAYIIEKHFPGREHRVLTVGDKVIAAGNRVPANVTGDGTSTIAELIKYKNKEKRKNPILAKKPIKVDFEVESFIKREGYTLDSVPAKGETIFLRHKSNVSAGGDFLDSTDELTPEVKQIAVKAVEAIPGLTHGGVDIIVDPDDPTKGTVIEINATPEVGAHPFPSTGKARDVPGAIIDLYFPETIGNEKTSFYFNYSSILEPLLTRSVNEVEVAPSPKGKVYAQKFTVTGDVYKNSYMKWIRDQAVKRDLNGKAKFDQNGNLIVIAAGTDQSKVKNFKNTLAKNKSLVKVEEVETEPWNEPVQIGFIIEEKKKESSTESLEEEIEHLKAEKNEIIEQFKEKIKHEMKEKSLLEKKLKKLEKKLH